MTERKMTVNTKMGGAIEVQVGDSQESPMQRRSMGGPGIFHNPGATHVEAATGEVKVMGTQTFNGSNIRSGIDTGSIMASCLDPQGRPVSDHSKITDDCSVEIDGIRTTIAAARRLGYITAANGVYRDSNNPQPPSQSSQSSQPKQNDNPTPIADGKTAAAIQAMRGDNPDYVNSLLAKAMGRAAAGKDGTEAANALAVELGLENAQEGADLFNKLMTNM